MLKLLTNIFYAFVLTLLVSACSSTNKELDGLDEVSYKIVQERLDFEKNQNPAMTFEIDKNTDSSLSMLLDAHIKIMYKINLKGSKSSKVKSILHIELNSDKRVKLHKLLIQKNDYYFDSVNNAVYVVIDMPYIYMLDKKLTLELSMSMITKKRKLVTRDISMHFETAPMQDNDEKYMSFKYENSFNSDKVDPFILSMIRSELRKSNKSNFDSDYVNRHKKLFEVAE